MKRILKIVLRFLLLVIIAIICFYFWASSSTLDKKEYAKLITNTYKNRVDNDSVFIIITYNIGYLSGMTNNLAVTKPKELFDLNLKTVLTEIEAVSPDIIALQEIDYNTSRSFNVNQQNEIVKLGFNYVAEAVNWDKRYIPFPYLPISTHFKKVVSGQSIISKYLLSFTRLFCSTC